MYLEHYVCGRSHVALSSAAMTPGSVDVSNVLGPFGAM